MDYCDDIKDETITSTINTIVHEICHGYTGEYGDIVAAKNGKHGTHYYFYISNDNSLLVKLTDTFPSKKMKDEFPPELKTFRFSYIDTTETILSTQSHGIYGLLDEWNAYLQGTKAGYLLYPYFMKKDKIAYCGHYFQGINSTLYGILEFKFFVLNYLLYAEKHEKRIYKNIMENDSFKNAVREINTESYDFITEYLAKKEELYSRIRENGFSVSEGDEFLYIGKSVSAASGFSHFFNVYMTLRMEMEKPVYQWLMQKLGITGEDLHFPEIIIPERDREVSFEERITYEVSEEFITSEFDEEDWEQGWEQSEMGNFYTLHPVVPGSNHMTVQFKDKKGDAEKEFADITSCSITYTENEIHLVMNLVDLPEKLTINHTGVNNYFIEYEWKFEIDVNNDDIIDLVCTVGHAKEKGRKPSLASIHTAMDKSVWLKKGNTLEYLYIHCPVELLKSGIIFKLKRGSHPLISNMDNGFKVSFSTYYYDGKITSADTID